MYFFCICILYCSLNRNGGDLGKENVFRVVVCVLGVIGRDVDYIKEVFVVVGYRGYLYGWVIFVIEIVWMFFFMYLFVSLLIEF